MDELNRHRGAQCALAIAGDGFRGRHHEQGPQALAAIEDGIAHDRTEAGRGFAGHPTLQGAFDILLTSAHPPGEIIDLHVRVQGFN